MLQLNFPNLKNSEELHKLGKKVKEMSLEENEQSWKTEEFPSDTIHTHTQKAP
jgi:hypothetical protein